MKPLLDAIRRIEREGKLTAEWHAMEVRHTEGGSMAIKIPVRWHPHHDRQKTMEYLEEFLDHNKPQGITKEVESDFDTGKQTHFLLIQHQTAAHHVPRTLRLLQGYGTLRKSSKIDLGEAKEWVRPHAQNLQDTGGGKPAGRRKRKEGANWTDGFVVREKDRPNPN